MNLSNFRITPLRWSMKEYGLSLLLMSTYIAEGSIQDVIPKMSLRSFNDLHISEVQLKGEEIERRKHSWGINDLFGPAQTLFFDSKNPTWDSGKVTVKNKVIEAFTIIKEDSDSTHCSRIFKDMIKAHGHSYSIHRFKSFSESGLSFEWISDEFLWSYAVIPKSNDHWHCQFSFSLAGDEQLSKHNVNPNDPFVEEIVGSLLSVTVLLLTEGATR